MSSVKTWDEHTTDNDMACPGVVILWLGIPVLNISLVAPSLL